MSRIKNEIVTAISDALYESLEIFEKHLKNEGVGKAVDTLIELNEKSGIKDISKEAEKLKKEAGLNSAVEACVECLVNKDIKGALKNIKEIKKINKDKALKADLKELQKDAKNRKKKAGIDNAAKDAGKRFVKASVGATLEIAGKPFKKVTDFIKDGIKTFPSGIKTKKDTNEAIRIHAMKNMANNR